MLSSSPVVPDEAFWRFVPLTIGRSEGNSVGKADGLRSAFKGMLVTVSKPPSAGKRKGVWRVVREDALTDSGAETTDRHQVPLFCPDTTIMR